MHTQMHTQLIHNPAEDLKQMCRYSVPSVPPHLGSSKARAPLPLPLGSDRPPIAYFLTGYPFTIAIEISTQKGRLKK